MIQLIEKGKWYLTIYNDRDQPQEIGVARRTIGKAVYKNISASCGGNTIENVYLQHRQRTVLCFFCFPGIFNMSRCFQTFAFTISSYWS